MKKTMRSLLTVILVFVMLFGVLAPTVAAAPSASSSGSSSDEVSGSLETGWFDIAYDEDSVSIVLRPDKEEISGTSFSELKNILGTLLDAITTVVIDDIKSDVMDQYGSLTAEEAVAQAFDKYIEDKVTSGATLEAKYVEFFKAAFDDATLIDDFAAYICAMLADGVRTGYIDMAKLPVRDDDDGVLEEGEISHKLHEVIYAKVDEIVETHVMDYVAEYLKMFTEDNYTPNIEQNVLEYANGLTTQHVIDEAELVNGGAEVNSKVREIIKAYLDAGESLVELEADPIGFLKSSFADMRADASLAGDYDALVAEIEDIIFDELHTEGAKDEVVAEYLGVADVTELDRKRDDYIALIATKYAVTLDELKVDSTLSTTDILSLLRAVSVTDADATYNILATAPGELAKVSKYDLVEFINSLPTFEQLATMSAAEMNWSWSVLIVTDYGDSNFTLSVKLGEGENADETAAYAKRVNKIFELINKYFRFSVDHEDNLTLGLTLPTKFAELLEGGLNSDSVPDSIKKKIYDLFSMSVAQIADDLDETTFDVIISNLEKVDFEAILDSNAVKNYLDLTNLTNEGIIEKIKSFKDELMLVKKLVVDVLRSVPEEHQGESLLDYYYKNGAFYYRNSHTLDLEAVFTAISEKHGPFIASFFDPAEFDYITVDLDLTMRQMYRVRYKVGDTVVSQGMLPYGANVGFFGPKDNGVFSIGRWVDEKTGATVVTMPGTDTVLVPVYELDPSSWDYTEAFTYNGEVQKVELVAIPDGYEVSYTYYGVVNGEADLTAPVSAPVNAGDYIVYATITRGGEACDLEIDPLLFTIKKCEIDLSGADWTLGEFDYNGEEKKVELAVGTLLDGVKDEVIVYTENTATVVGDYTATVEVNPELNLNNYTVTLPLVTTYDWKINKGTIDMSGVSVPDRYEVDYDGKYHQIPVIGMLPNGVVTVMPSIKFPGDYDITVQFVYTGEDSENYNEIPSLQSKLTIIPKYSYDFDFKDSADNVIVGVDSSAGLLIDYKLQVNDKSFTYVGFELPDGTYGKVVVAYDINFIQDGTVQNVGGGFDVRIFIPEAYRENETLTLIYVDDNGNVEMLEGELEGEYMTFETDHFSTYAIVEITDPPVYPTEADYTWLWILLAVIGGLVVIGAVIVIIILIRRRKGKGGDEPTDPTDATPDEPSCEPDGGDPTDTTPEEPVAEPDEADTAEVAEPESEHPFTVAPEDETPDESLMTRLPDEEYPFIVAPEDEAPDESLMTRDPKREPVLIRFAEDGEDGENRGDIDGEVVLVRFRTSFESRYIQSGELQDYYTAIKNALMSYKGIKARTSWNYESFNKGRVQCAKLNIKGNALLVYLNLDPASYNINKYHFTDMSDKPKFESVPMLMKVKSERALKYVLELIKEMMSKLEIPEGKAENKDYHMPYETTEALAARGLVKIILPAGMTLDENSNVVRVDVGAHIASELSEGTDEPTVEAAPVEEPAVEVAPAEEPVAEEPAEDVDEDAEGEEAIDGLNIIARYDYSCEAKLALATDAVKDFYRAIVSFAKSYGVKVARSWKHERVYKGRKLFALIFFRGTKLCVALAKDPATAEAKYHGKDVSSYKKYEKTPMMMRVTSERKVKQVIEILAELFAEAGLKDKALGITEPPVMHKTLERLIDEELVKVLNADVADEAAEDVTVEEPAVDEAPAEEPAVEETPAEEPVVEEPVAEEPVLEPEVEEEIATEEPVIELVAEIVHVDAEHADEILTNEEAEAKIYVVHTGASKRRGKLAVVNLDVICENFNEGEVVNIDSLKAKKLVPKNAARVKVLARGVMTKALTVVASKYSLSAVKMIYLAGGIAEVED